MTLVSVVMPNYNHGVFIERALMSVTAQTHADLEIIIIDDGSSDDSIVRMERLAKGDSRIRTLSNEHNLGTPFTLNRGIQRASGQYLCFIASDDIFRPERVEKMLGAISNEPETFSYSDIFKIDEQDRIIKASSSGHMPPNGNAYSWMLSHGLTGTGPILIPKRIIDKVGLYDESLTWGEDLDYMLRLTERFEIAVVREPLYGYRIHKARKTSRVDLNQAARIEAQILESNLKRNWRMLDDDVKYRVIRRIQRSAIESNNLWKVAKWSAKPPFIRVGSKKFLNRFR